MTFWGLTILIDNQNHNYDYLFIFNTKPSCKHKIGNYLLKIFLGVETNFLHVASVLTN